MPAVPDVVVLGNSNVDLTSYVARIPDEGETVLAESFVVGMGGKGANQAVAAARAGGSVAFIGAIGWDHFGEMTAEALEAEGLLLEGLQRVDTPTGVASIYVDSSGANRIIVFLGASATLTPDRVQTSVARYAGAQVAVSQMEIDQELVVAGLLEARRHGMITVLNTAPYSPIDSRLRGSLDWLIANEGEARALLAESGVQADLDQPVEGLLTEIAQWAAHLGSDLVVTLGERGALGVRRGDEPFWVDAPATQAVDTVGAGDCFVGYFARFIASTEPWQGALYAAVHAASVSVSRAGAQSSYPPADSAHEYEALAARAVAISRGETGGA